MRKVFVLASLAVMTASVLGMHVADVNERSSSPSVSEIFEASAGNHISSVGSYLDAGFNPNYRDLEGQTLLLEAIKRDDELCVKLLVSYGADVDKEGKRGKAPLLYACEKGNENIVKYLIDYGADVNKESMNGKTPLFAARRSGNADLVKYLIEHGADVNQENKDKGISLFEACESGNLDMVKYLIDHGADVNEKNKEGLTSLKYIMKHLWIDVDQATKLESIIELLVKCGADANETYCGTSSSYSLLSYSLGVFPNPINLVKTLVEHNADINVLCTGVPCVELEKGTWTVSLKKETPLDIAEKKGFTEIVEYLKGKGAKSAKDLSPNLDA